jgi:hypothetical protein
MPRHIQKTNQQFLKETMSFSRHGALAEMFVMDAVGKLADAVASSTLADYPDNNLVHPASWIGVAKEIKQKLDAHYGRGGEQQEAA